jgi:lipopolysaccharide/colanic/teichoic acid biosynthesis glycosyltransferase
MTAAPISSHCSGRRRVVYLGAKRLFDVVGAALILTATAPLLLAAAVAVKCSSPGPVLHRARRAGRGGVPFTMFKFRTMRVPAPADRGRKITDAVDDRITRTGALLRRTKIDELPQLLNVLKGDMSLVGPRPEDFDLVECHYTPELRRALWTRPGIACTAEIRWYPDLTYHDPPPPGVSLQDHYVARHLPAQAAEGVRYVERQGLLLDLQILAHTVVNVLVRSWWPPPRRPLSLPVDGDPRR